MELLLAHLAISKWAQNPGARNNILCAQMPETKNYLSPTPKTRLSDRKYLSPTLKSGLGDRKTTCHRRSKRSQVTGNTCHLRSKRPQVTGKYLSPTLKSGLGDRKTTCHQRLNRTSMTGNACRQRSNRTSVAGNLSVASLHHDPCCDFSARLPKHSMEIASTGREITHSGKQARNLPSPVPVSHPPSPYTFLVTSAGSSSRGSITAAPSWSESLSRSLTTLFIFANCSGETSCPTSSLVS